MVELGITIDMKIPVWMQLLVVPDNTMSSPAVLGRDCLKKLGLTLRELEDPVENHIFDIMNIDAASDGSDNEILFINPDIPQETQNKLNYIFKEKYLYPDRPDEPKIKGEIKLTLVDSQPFSCQPRRLSYAEKRRVEEIIKGWIKKGVIRPSSSEFASAIVLVRKKNGELRICVDYRILNKVTVRDNFPLPLIEDQLDVLNDKKFFTILDMKDGFHHLRVAEESIKYFSFVTPTGQYEFLKMPFGLNHYTLIFFKFQKVFKLAIILKTFEKISKY